MKICGEEEIDQVIEDIREFVKWPYCSFLNHVEILNEKNILLIIKDRYNLLEINIGKEQLEEDNLEQLETDMTKIVTDYNIRKNNIDVAEFGYIYEFKRVLD